MFKLNKDNVINIIMLAFAFLLLFTSYIISIYTNEHKRIGEEFKPVNIYFINHDGNSLEAERRYVKKGDINSEVSWVLAELISGPTNPNLSRVMPAHDWGSEEYSFGARINMAMRAENTNVGIVEIFFSEEYHELSMAEELLLRSALVYSFTELEFVEAVKIYVNDEELRRNNNELMGAMNRDNLYVNTVLSREQSFRTITLYFPNESKTHLLREEREVEISNRQIEDIIVEELIKGPNTLGLIAVIPSDTQVNDITIYERVFYVDLNSAFLSRIAADSKVFDLAIYSIVNSLTEISEINLRRVQFYIDSQIQEGVTGGIDITKIIERNEELIGN